MGFFEDAGRTVERFKQSLTEDERRCSECEAVVESGEEECPECGAVVGEDGKGEA